MKTMRRPFLMETALFMRSRGYSTRSIREITGLSERELLRAYALERLTDRGKGGRFRPSRGAHEGRSGREAPGGA